MSNDRTPHCVYGALQLALERAIDQPFDSALLFPLLGGHTFLVERLLNEHAPVYRVEGSIIRYQEFLPHTGIELKRVDELDAERAFATTSKELQTRGWQLVFTNCFYLPYDEANYRKHSSNHLVLLCAYEEERREFVVSDAQYKQVKIDRDVMWNARLKTLPGQNKYQSLRVEVQKALSEERVRQQARRRMKEQAEQFRADSHRLEAFFQVLEELGACEGIHRAFACNALATELRNPNSMVITRRLLAESCEELFPEATDAYRELSGAWMSFSNQLVRFAHRALNTEQMKELYGQVYAQERAANQRLLDCQTRT
jgi:hypothetical protein